MKNIILILLILLLTLSGCGTEEPETVIGSTAPPTETIPFRTGWQVVNGKRRFFLPDGTMAVGTMEIEGKTYHFTASGQSFLLVNLQNPLPEDYVPNLVELEGFYVSEDCVDALRAMMADCRAAGHTCVINTAYRDIEYQQMLWDNRYDNYIAQGYSHQEAYTMSARYVMPPGHSEHHTGLAVDITGTEEMYAWLAQHAPEYGFILRYPKDKTQWTDVSYEPWHFRYVGRELALELQSLGYTPEEYLYYLTIGALPTG